MRGEERGTGNEGGADNTVEETLGFGMGLVFKFKTVAVSCEVLLPPSQVGARWERLGLLRFW